MMKNFKFLADDNFEYEELGENLASWIWTKADELNTYEGFEWQIEIANTNGIIEFLEMFHPQMIVYVEQIVGNGITHTAYDEERNGWGFNIQQDPLMIVYFKLVPLYPNNARV